MDLSLVVASLAPMGAPVLVWLVGVVLAVNRWKRHKKASTWLLVGLAIIFVGTVTSRMFGLWLPFMARSRGWNIHDIGIISSVMNISLSLFTTSGWACVIAAVFSERAPAQSPT